MFSKEFLPEQVIRNGGVGIKPHIGFEKARQVFVTEDGSKVGLEGSLESAAYLIVAKRFPKPKSRHEVLKKRKIDIGRGVIWTATTDTLFLEFETKEIAEDVAVAVQQTIRFFAENDEE